MSSKKTFQAGDIIRFTGPLSMTPEAEPGYYARGVRARVEIYDVDDGEMEIVTDDAGDRGRKGSIHRRQVTHRLRRRERSEKRDRVERWLRVGPGASDYAYHERDNAELDRDVTQRIVRLVECAENEVVLSRAELAKAWEKSVGENLNPHLRIGGSVFETMAKILGLGAE